MLIAEGYLISRQGAPTRVADGLSLPAPAAGGQLSGGRPQEIRFSFRTGRPDLRCFPRRQWLHALRRASESLAPEEYGYAGPEGQDALREEIADWLFRSRGLSVRAQDIFITAGATHALNLACDVLDLKGRTVLAEDPCHSGILQTFKARDCVIVPIPVDGNGLHTDAIAGVPDAAAVYVTPSHQFPLGAILSAPRRAALIRYAREHDAYIIEDDYDSEFRYGGAPVAPLCAMDPLRVIYVGTFSKVLFPALRIGYAVVPGPLQKKWRFLRTHDDVQNPPFEQAALSEFLRTRQLDGHIRKMRKLYGKRRDTLLEALRASFCGCSASGDAAGLHVAVDFPGKSFDANFRRRARRAGLELATVEEHCIVKGRYPGRLLLGYGHLEPDEIRAAVAALHDFMETDIPVKK
jgi:GntR family transcriptional regulator/MocR family aminotransferase